MDDRLRDYARDAHAKFDKTRCAAWLLATGNRPVKPPEGGLIDAQYKTAQIVSIQAEPQPEFGCDIHRVET